jgi:hypothetical protein
MKVARTHRLKGRAPAVIRARQVTRQARADRSGQHRESPGTAVGMGPSAGEVEQRAAPVAPFSKRTAGSFG